MDNQIEHEYIYEMRVTPSLFLIFIGLLCEWFLIIDSSGSDIFRLVQMGLLSDIANFWFMTSLMMSLVLLGVLGLIAKINGFGRILLTSEGVVFPRPIWRLGNMHVPYGVIVDLDFRKVFLNQFFDIKTDKKTYSFVSRNFQNSNQFQHFCSELSRWSQVPLNNSIFKSEVPVRTESGPIDYTLYKISGIGVASLFGGPIAGGMLMARNFKQLGKEKEARAAGALSILATLMVVIVGYFIPEEWNISNTSIAIPLVFATVLIAQHLQQNDINAHLHSGGEFSSNWKAFGFSLLVWLALFGLILSVAIVWQILAG